MLLGERVDFSGNILCNTYNVNFQIFTLILHQCCYLNYFLKLSSLLRGLTPCVFLAVNCDAELTFRTAAELIPCGLKAKSCFRADHL